MYCTMTRTEFLLERLVIRTLLGVLCVVKTVTVSVGYVRVTVLSIFTSHIDSLLMLSPVEKFHQSLLKQA